MTRRDFRAFAPAVVVLCALIVGCPPKASAWETDHMTAVTAQRPVSQNLLNLQVDEISKDGEYIVLNGEVYRITIASEFVTSSANGQPDVRPLRSSLRFLKKGDVVHVSYFVEQPLRKVPGPPHDRVLDKLYLVGSSKQ